MLNYSTHFSLHLEQLRAPHVSTTQGLHANASEAGECDRKLFYKYVSALSTDRVREPVSDTSAITFHIGNDLHDQFQSLMAFLYPSFKPEQSWSYPDAQNPVITGRCDGTYTNEDGKTVALEIKTCSKFNYNRTVGSDVPMPLPEHALQAALSAFVLGTDLVQIIYICKDWLPDLQPVHSWIYPVATHVSTQEIARMTQLMKRARTGTPIPLRVIRGQEVDDPTQDSRCRFCEYQDDCVIDGPPIVAAAPRRRKRSA